jgi:hypothetical protein
MFYYGVDLVDVIAGRGPSPVCVNQLVQRLPDTSLTVALVSGGREHFGWGVDRCLQADIYDALNLNTRATGDYAKDKAPKFPPYPRPAFKTEEVKAKVTVASLYAQFSRR